MSYTAGEARKLDCCSGSSKHFEPANQWSSLQQTKSVGQEWRLLTSALISLRAFRSPEWNLFPSRNSTTRHSNWDCTPQAKEKGIRQENSWVTSALATCQA